MWVLRIFFLSSLLILIFDGYCKYFLLYFVSYFNIKTNIRVLLRFEFKPQLGEQRAGLRLSAPLPASRLSASFLMGSFVFFSFTIIELAVYKAHCAGACTRRHVWPLACLRRGTVGGFPFLARHLQGTPSGPKAGHILPCSLHTQQGRSRWGRSGRRVPRELGLSVGFHTCRPGSRPPDLGMTSEWPGSARGLRASGWRGGA